MFSESCNITYRENKWGTYR